MSLTDLARTCHVKGGKNLFIKTEDIHTLRTVTLTELTKNRKTMNDLYVQQHKLRVGSEGPVPQEVKVHQCKWSLTQKKVLPRILVVESEWSAKF